MLGAVASLVACGAPAVDPVESSDEALATPSGQAATFTIEGDYENIGNATEDMLKSDVREQLKFALPQLHARRGAAQLAWWPRLFERFEVTSAGNVQRVRYVAKIDGIWTGTMPAADQPIAITLPRTTWSLVRSEYLACAPALEGDMARYQYFGLSFDPAAQGCALTSAVAVPATVKVAPRVDPDATTGKSPEYAKMWEDQKLRVLVLFDKDQDDASYSDATSTDPGIVAFKSHLAALDAKLGTDNRTEALYNPVNGQPQQNVSVTHKRTLADGREIIVDSVLVNPGYGSAPTYPQLAAGAPVDAVIRNASPFADHYIDPSNALVVNGSANPQNLMLLVNNARYSYEFALPVNPTPGLSRFKNTIEYGGNVPYSVQADVTAKVIDALENQTKTYDTLLTDIEGVSADLLPIVTGEQQNGQ